MLNRLQHDTAVVVQGPPGTGKTHTIANLISALLAIGQRVLVTSQKDQALKVLRDKLPEPVRDLCVLLTDLRRGGTDELERSVRNLSDRTATSDVDQIRRKIERLEDQRNELRGRCTRVTEELRNLREAETYHHHESDVAPGYQGTLAEIAEVVMAARSHHGWMPAMPEQAPPSPPLSEADALQLRSLLSTTTATRMARRRQRLPSVQDLPGAGPQRGQLPLHHLIEIAHRNHWIQADAQKFSHVLRDYRNLVHVPRPIPDRRRARRRHLQCVLVRRGRHTERPRSHRSPKIVHMLTPTDGPKIMS